MFTIKLHENILNLLLPKLQNVICVGSAIQLIELLCYVFLNFKCLLFFVQVNHQEANLLVEDADFDHEVFDFFLVVILFALVNSESKSRCFVNDLAIDEEFVLFLAHVSHSFAEIERLVFMTLYHFV